MTYIQTTHLCLIRIWLWQALLFVCFYKEVYRNRFPGGSESTCNAEDWGLIHRSGRSPGEGNPDRIPTPVFLPGEFHGQGSLMGYSPWWGHKKLNTTERLTLSLSVLNIQKYGKKHRHIVPNATWWETLEAMTHWYQRSFKPPDLGVLVF